MAEEVQRPIPPDERAFRAHTSTGRFSAGVDAGEWRLVGDITWPHAIIAISAAPREDAPDEYFFRFELSGYPNIAATASVWNPATGCLAPETERPKVNYTPSPFRSDWNGGTALYIPCDRVGVQGHDWATAHPGELWEPTRGISKYLIYVHARLHEDSYTGL
jgi:hypothetical protein